MKVLLIGHRGLLGSDLMFFNIHKKMFDFQLLDSAIRWPSAEFRKEVIESNCEVIINCISSREYLKESIIKSVHYELPMWLISHSTKKVVNFSTDIAQKLAIGGTLSPKYVYYAKYKLLMEQESSNRTNSLVIRTSIIGLSNVESNLISRVFYNNLGIKPIKCSNNDSWNGVTTLQLYKKLSEIIHDSAFCGEIVSIVSKPLSMHNLFSIINEQFKFRAVIETTVNEDSTITDTSSDCQVPDLFSQIKELSVHYNANKSLFLAQKNNLSLWE